MQITLERSKPTFEPVTLTLKFESETELEAFQDLMGYEMTIPKVLLERNYIKQDQAEIIERIMRNIYKKLRYNK